MLASASRSFRGAPSHVSELSPPCLGGSKNHSAERMSKSQDSQERGAQPAPSASHTQLPKELQRLVDDEDSLLDQIYDGT